MRKIKLSIMACVSAVLLIACAHSYQNSARPDWIENPGSNVVGKCGTHIMGTIAQEQCAYQKGLAYIAMSKGVSVDVSADMTMQQTSTQKTGTSYGKMHANVRMDEKNIRVSATIVDKWHDRVADIMYVLIKEN